VNKKILRWGLLSTAAINRAVIPALQESSRNELVAVASRDLARAEPYAKHWAIPRAYGSYEAMLAEPEIDAVYISLPNSLHVPWTIAAARAGKHVLCEKPLALSVEEVDAVAEAAQQSGVVVAEAFMYRHHPQTIEVQRLIQSGAIGALRQVFGGFGFYLTREHDIRLDPELGGGSIWDVGCYPVNYARSVIGAEPVEVFGWQMTGDSGVDVGFVGQLVFPDQVFFQFECGFQHAERQTMQFVGETGTLSVMDPFIPDGNAGIILRNAEGDEEIIRLEASNLYLGEVEDLYDSAVLGKTPRVTLADSRGNAAALTALLRSATTGTPLSID